jgi:hypothetical protein
MGKLNKIIKFTLANWYILCFTFGIAVFGFSLYLLLANWGRLDPSFFFGTGIIVMLFGLLIIIMQLIGCQAVNHQTEKHGVEFNLFYF